VSDVLTRESQPPDLVLSYGPRGDQVADLRLPRNAAEPPLVIFVHGGFWQAAYDRTHTGPLADALAADGFAVCAPEYRRVGQEGGDWPGTFEDIAAAVDALPGLVGAAVGGAVDLDRVVLGGHSAGGHLALWAASRDGQAEAAAVVSLAGVCDLADCFRQGLGGGAAGQLMGGGPDQYPDRYRQADPSALLPASAPVWLVHGDADDRVPVEQSRTYAERTNAAGGWASCRVLENCGHFELIDPLTPAWPDVLAAFRAGAGLA
jgi:acetyl esterase/lipase